jgi:hypothetical protein
VAPVRTMDEVLDLALRRDPQVVPAAGDAPRAPQARAEPRPETPRPPASGYPRPGVRRQRVPKAAQAGGGA